MSSFKPRVPSDITVLIKTLNIRTLSSIQLSYQAKTIELETLQPMEENEHLAHKPKQDQLCQDESYLLV